MSSFWPAAMLWASVQMVTYDREFLASRGALADFFIQLFCWFFSILTRRKIHCLSRALLPPQWKNILQWPLFIISHGFFFDGFHQNLLSCLRFKKSYVLPNIWLIFHLMITVNLPLSKCIFLFFSSWALVTGKLRIKLVVLFQQILGWPKCSFGFSISSYRKTPMNFLANPKYAF